MLKPPGTAAAGNDARALQANPREGVVGGAPGRWAIWAAISWLVSGALYLNLPPSPDQFNHAYLGWRLLAGELPYRDFIDMNWPGVMGLHALAEWLFGFNGWSWRAFDFLMFAVIAVLLADIVRQAAGADAAKVTLILAPMLYAGFGFWNSGQHDMSAGQLLVVALWCHIRANTRAISSWQIGTGLFLGLAMLNKPTIAVLWPLLVVQMLWLRVPALSVLRHALIAGTASVLTVGAAFAAVVGMGTPLGDVIDAVYRYNVATQFIDAPPISRLLSAPAKSVAWIGATLVSLLAMPWLLRSTNRSIASTAVPLLWLAGVLSYLAQSSGQIYHLGPSFLALAAGQSMALSLLASGRVRVAPRAWRGVVVSAVLLVVLGNLANRIYDAYRELPRALVSGDRSVFLAGFKGGDGISSADAARFVRQLRADPRAGCLLVVGEGSSINYLSQRPQPTRFYYFPVVSNLAVPSPMATRWTESWAGDLQVADCPLALVSSKASADWLAGPSPAAAALRNFLGNYRKTGTLGSAAGLAVYERNR